MVDMCITCSVLFLCFSFLQAIQGEVVHITVVAAGHTDVKYTSKGFQPRYQCYRSAPDTDALLSFGRSSAITSLLRPPPSKPHGRYPDVLEVPFPAGGGWDTNSFGPFYCQAYKAGRDVTRVTTFFQRSDAKFVPSDGLFTQTVNVNDTGVTITMTARYAANIDGNMINWRKNGGARIVSYDDISRITFPDPIQISDAGIYDVTYAYERNLGRGGLHRLIVRECQAGKWGPPECFGVCDKCFNGGVCDDKSGLCICPNNFRGPNCLEICRPGGGNRFGLNCEFRCTDNTRDRPTACHGKLFCLPDPYGCSCDVGVNGHGCDRVCSLGYYGPGCSQTCHCVTMWSSCDIYTGECAGRCQEGWSGNNCQIPDVCDVGYYGPQCIDKCHCLNDAPCQNVSGECPQLACAAGYMVRSGQNHCQECGDGSFGPDCLPLCHCAADACHKKTGRCDGQCLHNWIEPDCQTGISRLVLTRVNPYQSSTFTCYVEGTPLPVESSVHLYRVTANTYNNTGISRNWSFVSGMERGVVFDVDSVHPVQYVCNVSIAKREPAYFSMNNTTCVLPVMDEAPLVLNTWSSKVRLKWNAWSAGDDLGDPPLAGYDIFMKAESDWMKAIRVDQFTTSAIVRHLNPDTDYMFSVAAVRAGPGGTGPLSPGASAVTFCGKPSTSPTEVKITSKNLTELEVTWQPISNGSSECRSGVTHYVIYYITIGSTSANSVRVYNTTSNTITGLETYKDYTIQMTAANKDEESDMSIAIVSRTLGTVEEGSTTMPTERPLPIPLYVLIASIASPLVFLLLLTLGLVIGCRRIRAQRHLKDKPDTSSQCLQSITFNGDQDPSRVTLDPNYTSLNEHIYSSIPGTHPPDPGTQPPISGRNSPIPRQNSPTPRTNPPIPGTRMGKKPANPGKENAHPANKPAHPENKAALTGKKPAHPENKAALTDKKPAHPGTAHDTTELDPEPEQYAYAYIPATLTPIPGTHLPILGRNSPIPGTNPPIPGTRFGKKPAHPGKVHAHPGKVHAHPGNEIVHPGSAHDTTEDPEPEDYVNQVVIKTSETCRRPTKFKP